MKHQFILFQRAGIFYCEATGTGKQTSLRTRDRAEAERLLAAKNEAVRQPAMNLQIAQVYLHHSDPTLATRTWQTVKVAKRVQRSLSRMEPSTKMEFRKGFGRNY